MTAERRPVHAAGIDRLTDAAGIGELVLPAPSCGPDQVLLRVDAVAVNHVDTFVRSGVYATDLDFPVAVGRDAVGTVEATGTGVRGVGVGQRAWTNSLGFDGRPGATAELVAVDAERLYPLPDGVDPLIAAAALHPCATAALAVGRHGQLEAGQTVYVAGGAGQVGSAAIVVAKARGARVLASASAADADYCRGLGADVVLDYHDADLAGRLREAAPRGLNVQVDTSGHNDLEMAVDLAARRGRIVVMAGPASTPVLPAGQLYMRDASVHGFAISNATVGELAEAAQTVNTLLADRAWEPRNLVRGAFRDAGWAHAQLEAGQVHGTRIVLLPQHGDATAGR
ncbi:NADPH:quinone reductase [Arthrobacter sp. JSM 101049]|uniref:NADPH:quinone reductase n=1 Tax=Arthrobacter sp. JSM 101049 TaxID=929097 RepID=UPI003567401D